MNHKKKTKPKPADDVVSVDPNDIEIPEPWGVKKRPIALGIATALLGVWTLWLAYLAFQLVYTI